MARDSKASVKKLLMMAAMGLTIAGMGCSNPERKKASTTQPIVRYPSLGLRKVPAYLAGTIFERANLQDVQPFAVSGFGLVVNLRGTGDNSAIPTNVYDYMIKQMQVHGFGSHRVPGFENFSPEKILRDNRTAVVRVDGFVPPGARKDERFDIVVSAMEESYTSSLSHGDLFLTDLRYQGADPNQPAGSVNTYAVAAGPVFVNPAYALMGKKNLSTVAKQSLRYGVVMDGGTSTFDNPLTLRVREPQFSTSRAIEVRINRRFQSVADKSSKVGGPPTMAAAQDEGVILVYVPRIYRGNWEHFSGVVKHLYLNGEPAYLAQKAEQLAQAAMMPDAPLENISYALEGIGEPAMGVLKKLMAQKSPDVVYAAARAAAFIGDDTGEARAALVEIARTPEHAFRVNAVRTLADLPQSSETDQHLRQLVNSDNAVVRVEAYKALVRNNDPLVYTKVIQEKFVLDVIPSSGKPMIYASRRGIPRVAIFGRRQSLVTPLMFTAMDSRLTLTSEQPGSPVTIFYRSDERNGDRYTGSIRQLSRPDLADVIGRLGGEAPPEEKRLDFSYADVVALLQSMSQTEKLVSQTLEGNQVAVLLQIEEQTGVSAEQAGDATRIPDAGRKESQSDDKSVPKIPDLLDTQNPAGPATTPALGRKN